MRVLILGGRAPVALEHARRFARAGHQVWIGDSVSCRLSAASRVVSGVVQLPPPRTALCQFADALATAITKLKLDLILPTCEEVFFLSCIRHRLPASCNVFVAPFEQLRQLHSKFQFIALARDCGADVPETGSVTSIAEAKAWAGQRPVVLKPEFSRFGVHVRLYPDGLTDASKPLAPLGRWVAQEFRHGRELCSYAIAVNGRLMTNICYEPTYRIARSSSYYFEPAAVPAIDGFVKRFVERIAYTGQISFDWIVAQDHAPTVIECNPRAISGLHLFDDASQIANAILGDGIVEVDVARINPKMLAAVMLAVGLPAAMQRGVTRQWHRDWRRASDVLTAPDDSRPLLGAIRDIGSFVTTSLRDGCSIREASTRDIEWDGEPLLEC
jgi:hypothetical protein